MLVPKLKVVLDTDEEIIFSCREDEAIKYEITNNHMVIKTEGNFTACFNFDKVKYALNSKSIAEKNRGECR